MTDDRRQALYEDLEELNRQDIPSFLLENECKGSRASASFCPVALYLKKKGYDLSVNAFVITLHGTDQRCGSDRHMINETESRTKFTTPHNVSKFIIDFDHQQYPELIK